MYCFYYQCSWTKFLYVNLFLAINVAVMKSITTFKPRGYHLVNDLSNTWWLQPLEARVSYRTTFMCPQDVSYFGMINSPEFMRKSKSTFLHLFDLRNQGNKAGNRMKNTDRNRTVPKNVNPFTSKQFRILYQNLLQRGGSVLGIQRKPKINTCLLPEL